MCLVSLMLFEMQLDVVLCTIFGKVVRGSRCVGSLCSVTCFESSASYPVGVALSLGLMCLSITLYIISNIRSFLSLAE